MKYDFEQLRQRTKPTSLSVFVDNVTEKEIKEAAKKHNTSVSAFFRGLWEQYKKDMAEQDSLEAGQV